MEEVFAEKFDLVQHDNAQLSGHNYSLVVGPIDLDDDGIYQCLKSNKVVSTYYLQVTYRFADYPHIMNIQNAIG